MARKNTPEQEMESERIGLINSIQRWKHLKEFGGQDPFWTDGVNMNLVRNHVIYAKNKIYAISKKYKLPIPDEFYLQTPPEVDDLYMANLDQKERVDRLRQLDRSGKGLTTKCKSYDDKQMSFI